MKVLYRASSGRVFDNEQDCLNHESRNPIIDNHDLSTLSSDIFCVIKADIQVKTDWENLNTYLNEIPEISKDAIPSKIMFDTPTGTFYVFCYYSEIEHKHVVYSEGEYNELLEALHF